MKIGTITKDNLQILLISFTDKYKVYAPSRGENGIELKEVNSDRSIAYDYINTKLSPKGIFFPQREVLFNYSNGELQPVNNISEDHYIVFGIRPCDALSLTYIDMIFEGANSNLNDPYYLKRRDNALIIALACNEPANTCFCTMVGGSPIGKEGSDIIVTELDDILLFEACTDKGKTLMDNNSNLFKEADSTLLSKKKEKEENVLEKLPKKRIENIKEKLDQSFDDPIWDTITRDCIGCGACTYLCPTCHCFDITDETDGNKDGVRIRTWDSCQYPLFTQHASGHNPRVDKKQRIRQRVMHKFSYTVENNGKMFCVGCGRCVLYCPVNLDIRDILKTFDIR